MNTSESPIFIVGMPRSGTTLMRSILSSHPNIAIAPETHYCNHFMHQVETAGHSDAAAFKSLWRIFSESDRFKDLGIDPAVVEQRVYQSGDFSLSNTFTLVLREYARQQARERWGEKTPHHYMYIRELLSWFPEARILVMVRDPRAVCSSMLRVPWRKWGGRGIGSLEPRGLKRARRASLDAVRWQLHIDDLRERWARDPRVKVVRYESLVQAPSDVVRQVCEFVNEHFVETMLAGRSWSVVAVRDYSSYSNGADAWVGEHLARSIAPISGESIDKWKETLLGSEVHCIERACSSGMKYLEYQEAYERTFRQTVLGELSWLWSVAYRKCSSESNVVQGSWGRLAENKTARPKSDKRQHDVS